MRILRLIILFLLALFVLAEANAQAPRPVIARATPWTYDVYGPGGNYRPTLPTLSGQPIRRFAGNWQEIVCWFTAYSVSPTAPPATQKLYLGNCPPRSELERGPPGSNLIPRPR